MSTNDLTDQYDQRAASFADSAKTVGYFSPAWFQFEQQAVLQWLGYTNNHSPGHDKILDVGCGVGLFSEPLAAKHFVVGLDISFIQLIYAQQKGLTGTVGSGFCLPFRANSFNKVLLIEVIQHFQPQQGNDLVRELGRMVAPQGELVIAGRNTYSIARKFSAPVLRILRKQVFELYGYQPDQLAKLLTILGFTDIQTAFVFPPLRYFKANPEPHWFSKFLGSSFVIRGKK